MKKKKKSTKRYRDCFKLQIIEEIEKNGLSISDCKRKYGITGGQTIQSWLNKFGKNHLLNKVIRVETKDEINEIKRLTEELNSLKLAYADLTVKHLCSETVIELGDELFNLDLKKKYEQELSKYFKKK